MLPAPDRLLRLGENGRLAQGRDGARRHRRLALGRLSRRRGPGERHSRQDFVVRSPPRERVDVPGQVFGHLCQLHPGEPGSAGQRLRRRPAARRRRLRRRRRGREPVPGQERPHLRTGADLGADGHHPRQRDRARRRPRLHGDAAAHHPRRPVHRRRGLLHRHRGRSHADTRSRRAQDRRRPARPDHAQTAKGVLRSGQRPGFAPQRLARARCRRQV